MQLLGHLAILFNFLKNHHTVCHSSCPILQPHWPYTRVPISPHLPHTCYVLFPQLFLKNIYLFSWAGFSLQHAGSRSLARSWTRPSALGAQSLSPQTTREVPCLAISSSLQVSTSLTYCRSDKWKYSLFWCIFPPELPISAGSCVPSVLLR